MSRASRNNFYPRLTPACSSSQSSTSSASSDHTPAPVTPPTLTNDIYPVTRYRSPSFDYYESPPSPPRTLQDQMHVAYAHDNMHLAKILLLKLKGIEVTDDQDPRIEQVKDEDFSSAFVPRGGLVMDEERERQCLEGQRREQERRRRRAREERLKVCEQIWENSSRALQQEKTKMARRKEAAACVRRKLDMEIRERERASKREREDVSRTTRPVRYSSGSHRPVLSYDNLPALRTRAPASTSRSPPKTAYQGPLFEYPYISTSTSRVSPPAYRSTKTTTEDPYRELSAMSSRAVPFAEVVASMHGPLFPVAEDEALPKKSKNIKELELLKSLLQPVTWDLGEQETVQRRGSSKGKARARVEDEPRLSASMSTSSLTISSSTSTSMQRSTSWFSFSSRLSISTAITSPSTSFMSHIKSFQPATPTDRDFLGAAEQPIKSAHAPRTLSTSVAPSETPLGDPTSISRFPTFAPEPSADGLFYARGRMLTRRGGVTTRSSSQVSVSSTASTSSLVARVGRSVSTFVDMAAQFQRAYIKATAYTANPDIYFSSPSYTRSRSRSGSRSRTRSPTVGRRCRAGQSPRPEGYRASSEDVEVFTSPDAGLAPPAPDRPLIPLAYTRGSAAPPADAPRVFPAPPPIPRSPFRLPYPPTTLTSRLRPVANPLLLRMRALQNLCRAEAQVPEVREKVVGVAWEGIGRSGLVREVKPSGALMDMADGRYAVAA